MKLKSTYKTRQQHLKNRMATALKALQNCATHPDNARSNAPMFLNYRADFKLSDQNDALLGSLAMENMLGVAFSAAANDSAASATDFSSLSLAATLDANDFADIAGEYSQETAADSKRGKGTKALYGTPKTSVIDFNKAKDYMRAKQIEEFESELPRRMMIEREISEIASELDMTRREENISFGLCA